MADDRETIGAKIEALHAKHFRDTHLGHDTRLFNAVRAFTAEVKKLVAPPEAKPDAAPPSKTA